MFDMDPMETAVVFDRVSKRFGQAQAVDDVSFEVRRGEMFGLIGPDGAGKTTTIRLMCGLIGADAGSIEVLGRNPVRDHRAVATNVGYFSQRFSLYGDLSVDENIAFFAEIHGLARFQDRRNRLLDMMQLTKFRGRAAERLSGGMKQKLALACTLVHEPTAIFLDEPTTGVDPVSRREFWKLLSEFLAQGITILMATPYLDEAERCSRVALLDQGRLLALDTPDQLRRSLPGVVVEVIAEPREAAVAALGAAREVVDVQAFGERIHVRLVCESGSAVKCVHAALAGTALSVASVRVVAASLEDVFINRVAPDRTAGRADQVPS
jgi:ABC-2 type transport system ATP-binding protein